MPNRKNCLTVLKALHAWLYTGVESGNPENEYKLKMKFTLALDEADHEFLADAIYAADGCIADGYFGQKADAWWGELKWEETADGGQLVGHWERIRDDGEGLARLEAFIDETKHELTSTDA
jgi:hypothetical protein